ncbi:MAG: hypothetical protein AB8B69_18695, partial [Chitinophagales bacterium]
MNTNFADFFDETGHFNATARIYYVEAMYQNQVDSLPPDLQQHISDCDYCSIKILQSYQIALELGKELTTSPKTEIGRFTLSDKQEDLEAILQQLMAEAIEIPVFEALIEEQVLRSTANESLSIEVLQPAQNQICQNTIIFQLKTALLKPLILSIRNHQKRMLKVTIPPNTREYSIEVQNWNKG